MAIKQFSSAADDAQVGDINLEKQLLPENGCNETSKRSDRVSRPLQAEQIVCLRDISCNSSIGNINIQTKMRSIASFALVICSQ